MKLKEHLIETQVNEIKKVWFDNYANGRLTRLGLRSILLVLGLDPTQDELLEYLPDESTAMDIVQFKNLVYNKIEERRKNYVVEKDTLERAVLTKDYLIFLKEHKKMSFDEALTDSKWDRNTFQFACRFYKITFPKPHPRGSSSSKKSGSSAPKIPETAGISVAIVLRNDQDKEEGKVINVEPTDITSLDYLHERIKRTFKLDSDAYTLEYKATNAGQWTVLDYEDDVNYMVKHMARDTRVHIIRNPSVTTTQTT